MITLNKKNDDTKNNSNNKNNNTNNNKLLISVLESIYLIYMFHYFKTSFDFNIFASSENWLFKHLIGNEKGLRICPFGRIVIIPFVIILLLRNFSFISIPKYFMNMLLVLSFILSWMNLNAVVYFIPVWIVEIFVIL